MNKIVIVGAGRVGESTAQFIASKDLCHELVLIDIRAGAAEGAALDIQEDGPLLQFDTKISGGDSPALMCDAELIIITAGIPRKPGMSRSDVLNINLKICDEIVKNAMQYAPKAMLLFVSNPVDVLTYHAWKTCGWPRSRVFGQAGVLDATRMASFIAMESGYSVRDIQAMVLGGHGDSMVPMMRFTTIAGIPVENFINAELLDKIIERTRNGGAEILALRQNSSAYDAPSAAIATMVDAIVHDRKRILPTVTILQGEYQCQDIAIGVPAVLGKDGLEQVIELKLNESELAEFSKSVKMVQDDITRIGTL